MTSFIDRMGNAATNSNTKGWLVAVLELGAWFGVLVSGYLADKLSRKYTIVLGTFPLESSKVLRPPDAVCLRTCGESAL